MWKESVATVNQCFWSLRSLSGTHGTTSVTRSNARFDILVHTIVVVVVVDCGHIQPPRTCLFAAIYHWQGSWLRISLGSTALMQLLWHAAL